MNRFRTSITAGAASLVLIVGFGAPTANAYGAGSWTVQPYGCNAGAFSGNSYWLNGLAKAETYESGNFCWLGNQPVWVAIHDEYSQVKAGYVYAPNWVFVSYNASYHPWWGGFHSWGSGTQGQRT